MVKNSCRSRLSVAYPVWPRQFQAASGDAHLAYIAAGAAGPGRGAVHTNAGAVAAGHSGAASPTGAAAAIGPSLLASAVRSADGCRAPAERGAFGQQLGLLAPVAANRFAIEVVGRILLAKVLTLYALATPGPGIAILAHKRHASADYGHSRSGAQLATPGSSVGKLLAQPVKS